MSEGTYFSKAELMVAQAAREIADGERVFVGMRLPLIAFVVAKRTHAPSAVGLFELGIVRDEPSPELLYTMGDTPNVAGAVWCARTIDLMGLLQRGDIDAGFIGGAEIDRHGNLNTTAIGPDRMHPDVQLPGSGGGGDIASLARRLIVIMPHDRRRLREKVDFVTSPGYGNGRGWRERQGLARGGPSVLITTLGVFRFVDGEAVLASFHPGSSVERIRAETGWDLRVAADVRETEPPSAEALRVIREYDPHGFWTRREE
ncbi:MAG: CoA-transferase [Chloroflexi bacterium]|nr:MAG: CoA-transferase [Chloroflexota bacterium]TMG37846.1 MAG: CoA-transferase [Chloroflexota bacterium]